MPERGGAGTPESALAEAVDFARSAVLEHEPAASVGGHLGHTVDDEGVVTHYFECWQSGYPGWRWAVTIARVDPGSEPTVVESQLVPGDGALLAPDWVPWSERLAEYQAQQAAEKAAAEASGPEDGDDEDDLDDEDEDDLDDDLDEDDLDDALDEELDGIELEDDDED